MNAVGRLKRGMNDSHWTGYFEHAVVKQAGTKASLVNISVPFL